jgi:redox-sensing transcriptional repressor
VYAGLPCILSFASVPLEVPVHVALRHVDLAVEMQLLSFHATRDALAREVPKGSVVRQ